jgi:subtilisin family serine protease
VVVIAAAGNNARNLNDQSVVATPCEQATLCVTATGPKLQQNFDQPAWYTNMGDLVIDLAAPGGNYDPLSSSTWQIEDLVIGPCSRRTTNPSLAGCRNPGVWYIYVAGTSQAVPHAVGVAALLDAKYGGSLVPGTVRDRLFRFSDDLGAAGEDDFYGFGRVNARKAVTESPTAPVASVTVSPSSATGPVGASGQFTATVKDANGNVLTGRTVTWASSNTSVATVDQTGLARAVGPGSAALVATCEGQSGQAQVTVTN